MGFSGVCFLYVLASACRIIGVNADKKTKTEEVCPGNNWAQLDSTCYYYLSSTKTWNAAEKDCETRGGTLLIFKEQSEVAKVFKQIKTIAQNIDSVPLFWMGVHNQDDDRVFRYADGSDVTKSNWKKMLNEASGSGRCLALKSSQSGSSSKSWALTDCKQTLPYVCEIQLSVARWSGWSQWTDCSVSCGEGSRTRTRTCLRATEASGECVGEAVKTEVCSNTCKLPAVWGEWSSWGACSKTCGTGQMKRTRSCLNSQDVSECVGEPEETGECSTEACPVWSEWTECSVTCGGGERSRTISCSGGKSCKDGSSGQTEVCGEATCPAWSDWQSWSTCSVTCGQGERSRSRKCSKGDTCPGESSEKEECREVDCAVWSEWSTCSVTCGRGERSRTSSCKGKKCKDGASQQTEECMETTCPVWTRWGEWGPCSQTCDTGTRSRSRSCPVVGGCRGESTETNNCKITDCPTWAKWSSWSTCSVTCGQGERSRSRECSKGDTCPGESSEKEECREVDCAVWSEWSACSVTCGRGERSRTSSCKGKKCKDGASQQTEECMETTCPVWTRWGEWGPCSQTCDTGTRSRSRSCPVVGGCRGESTETNNCKITDCPTWAKWSSWSTCSVTCGQGERSRSRECSKGDTCPGESSEKEECREVDCAVWTRWGEWGPCSQTCDTGTRSRSRSCPVSGVIGNHGVHAASHVVSVKGQGLENAAKVTSAKGRAVRQENVDRWIVQTGEAGVPGPSAAKPVGRVRGQGHGNVLVENAVEAVPRQKVAKFKIAPELGKWGDWTDCSVTCGKGKVTRSRPCSGLEKCGHDTLQTKSCNKPKCREKDHWTKWDLWSACSVTCGVGRSTRQRQCVNADGDIVNTCRGSDTESRQCLAPCNDVAIVQKLLRDCPPDQVAGLKKIQEKVSNKKKKEDIFNGQDTEDWVIEGYEIEEVIVDRPLTCAHKCLLTGSCRSFNYEYLLTDGKNDLSVPKRCMLNSVNKDYDRKALKEKEGYKLFDLEPFFI
ncbi:A disintegrin and metalloproteinase with thrombospondin motifs adt-1-like [Haliotis rubra]|uniref:A disintegrin and metalloproteinase with thrombospondin motifs adt-1-like n=1 Tax=Haliotis rubra TaxID=36100 RepID=UPI001EE591E1|nr:A disintegrin and metalloproteinase with thrombospondin motifs adt-1-like [Haliotis rubra]